MGVIVARPGRSTGGGSGDGNITVSLDGVELSTQIDELNFSGSFVVNVVGTTATIQLSGSGQAGGVMFSPDGGPPGMYVPLTSPDAGWLVDDSGSLLVVG